MAFICLGLNVWILHASLLRWIHSSEGVAARDAGVTDVLAAGWPAPLLGLIGPRQWRPHDHPAAQQSLDLPHQTQPPDTSARSGTLEHTGTATGPAAEFDCGLISRHGAHAVEPAASLSATDSHYIPTSAWCQSAGTVDAGRHEPCRSWNRLAYQGDTGLG